NAYDNPQDLQRLPGQKVATWGCDANRESYLPTRKADGSTGRIDTCLEVPTVGDQLSRDRIGWASYAATANQSGYIWNAFDSIGHVFYTDQRRRHVRPVDGLFRDVRRGALPSMTWVTPRMELSDHPPFSTCFSHAWLTELVNAVMRS